MSVLSLQQKLATDAYQRYFSGSAAVSLSSLQSLYEELAEDVNSTPAAVQRALVDRLASEAANYSEVKRAIETEFRSKRKSSSQSPDPGSTQRKSNAIRLKPTAHLEKMTISGALELFRQTHSETETAAFQSTLQDKVISAGKRTDAAAPVSLRTYTDCVQAWESHKSNTDPVVRKLEKTIADYKDALASLEADSPQQAAIRDLISTLEGQMKGLSVPADPIVLQKLQRRQFKSLQGIFAFYCKQQLNLGKATFENISESNSHWNLGKFVKFAVDFGITGKTTKEERLLSKDELKGVFLVCADKRKLMDYARFLTALSQVADKRYDATYDEIHRTKMQAKSLADKQALLFIDLHLEDVPTLKRTMKSFAVAFTHEKEGFRSPADDPAKRYQPLSEEQKEALQDWKKRKAIFSTGSATISSLQSSEESLHQTMIRVPSDAVALKRPPPENYSEMYHLRHNPVSLTWQTLSNMFYTDINVTDDIASIIGLERGADSEDGLLDKQYHLGKYYDGAAWKSHTLSSALNKSASERRYEGLMRLADEKVNRGMHSLARMSTTLSVLNQSSFPS